MSRRLVQTFGGVRAAVLHAPDRNRAVLCDTLVKLGLKVSHVDPDGEEAKALEILEHAEIVFFDADVADSPCLPLDGHLAPMPLVAMIGLETPTRLQRAFEIGPSAVLCKPIRPGGIYSALFFAANEHRRRQETVERLKALEARLGARRFVQKAVLRLMERHGIDDEQAYRYLRKESMRQRMTVEDLAVRILAVGTDRVGTVRKA